MGRKSDRSEQLSVKVHSPDPRCHQCLIGRFAAFVPWVVGVLVGLGIALLGTQTGGSLNPARQFGPAVMSGHTAKLWVFLIAPMAGAEGGARLLDFFQKRRRVLTHRRCGTQLNGEPLDEGSVQKEAL
jgi:hypothetical protein